MHTLREDYRATISSQIKSWESTRRGSQTDGVNCNNNLLNKEYRRRDGRQVFYKSRGSKRDARTSALRLRVSGICEILREQRGRLFVVLEGSVLSLVLPRSVRGQSCSVTVRCDFLTELEDSHPDGDDETEERKLKSVPSFETEDTDGQGDESHGLEQDKH